MFIFCIWISKFTNLVINLLKLGSGNTWPGHIALKVYPTLLHSSYVDYKDGVILVAGTNGKTTTAKLISHILRGNEFHVVNNKSGANLLNGIASAVLLDFNLTGKTKSTVAVFEVDEFALPQVAQIFKPKAIVLLNLSRDQLDRYGEVDTILTKWKNALVNNNPTPTLIVDKTQNRFAPILSSFKGSILFFEPNMQALQKTKLVGDFNAKNISAALTVATLFNISAEKSLDSLQNFDAAYGRGEVINYQQKEFQLFLAKNPLSFNNNLDLFLSNVVNSKCILFVLNDDPRDGRDVSWFYDVNAEKLKGVCANKKIFVSGTRCYDFAVRLKYAGVNLEDEYVNVNLPELINNISRIQSIERVLVLPNYSAMLNVRKVLTGKQIL